MKKQGTNKSILESEVQELIKKETPREHKSVSIIYSFEGRYKLDLISFDLEEKHDERKGFSMDSLTEDQAREMYESPDSYFIHFQERQNMPPKWGKHMLVIPVSGSDLQAVKAFFDHDFKPMVFPPSQMISGENYYRFIETDPWTLWFHSPERKLWQNVKKIWCDFLDRESGRIHRQ